MEGKVGSRPHEQRLLSRVQKKKLTYNINILTLTYQRYIWVGKCYINFL